MIKTLKQYKTEKGKFNATCGGCTQLNRLEGKVDAVLILHKVDPAKVLLKNPGVPNRNYLKFCLYGKDAMAFAKWFIGTLLSVGAVTALLYAMGVF